MPVREKLRPDEPFRGFLAIMFGGANTLQLDDVGSVYRGNEIEITDLIVAGKMNGSFTFDIVAQNVPDSYLGSGNRANLESWLRLWRVLIFFTHHYQMKPMLGLSEQAGRGAPPDRNSGSQSPRQPHSGSVRKQIIDQLGSGSTKAALQKLSEIKGDRTWKDVPALLAKAPYDIVITYGYLNSLMTGLRKEAESE
ncbi:MAG: hypothetical protein WC505_00110 [Patescibacteria group bacterium]